MKPPFNTSRRNPSHALPAHRIHRTLGLDPYNPASLQRAISTIFICLAALLLAQPGAFATGTSVLGSMASLTLTGGAYCSTSGTVSVPAPPIIGGTMTAWNIDVTSLPPGGSSGVELSGDNTTTIYKGDLVVFSFYYRRADAYSNFNLNVGAVNNPSGSSAETNMSVHFENTASPYQASLDRSLRGRGEWRFMAIPFVAGSTYSANQAKFDFQLGSQTQDIQIGAITAVDYSNGSTLSLFGSGVVDATSLFKPQSPKQGYSTTGTANLPPVTTQDAFTSEVQVTSTSTTTTGNGVGLQWDGTAAAITPQKGDTMVAVFWMRNALATTGTDPFAFVRVQVQQDVTYAKSYYHDDNMFPVDGNWNQYVIPFTISSSGSNYTSTYALNVFFETGYHQNMLQSVQFAGLNILDLGQAGSGPQACNNLSTDGFYYSGESLSDPWRQTAASGIALYRTGTFSVYTTTQAGGTTLAGVAVSGSMTSPLFGFGSGVDSTEVTGGTSALESGTYQTAVQDLFNKVSTLNNLKWVVWEGTNGTITTGTDPGAAIAELGIAWFRNHGIFNIRGHNVIWPDWSQLPGDVNILTGTGTIAGKQTQVEDRITTVGEGSYPGHMSNEAGNTHIKSFLRDWDAVNEPFVKFTVLNYFIGQSATEGSIRSASQYLEDSGSDAVTIENWLIPLVATDPLPYLFINENGLETNYLHCPNDNITMDTYNPPINQEECYLYNLLLTLSSTATESVPIDGFGFESHFETDNGSDLNQAIIDTPLTPPVTLQQVFGEFAGLNILAEATEYDQGLYYYSYAVANENPIDNNAPNWMTPMQYMSAQAIQADYLTDYLTVVYSTPNFDSFTSWGFWDGDGEDWPNCNAPIYNKDWSLKPSGLAWVNLVKNAWWTSATSGTSNGSGVAPVSGFLGRYSLKGSYGGYTKTYHVTLTASAAGGTTTPVQMEFNGTSGSKNVWLYNAVDSALENRAFGTQDPTAYGGFYVTGPGYIYFPSPTSYPTPDMRIDLDPSDALPTGDTVYVWFRCKVPDSNTGDNKFYYDMNNGNYTETPVLSGTNTWQWNKVEQVTLTSGTSYSVGVVWSGSNLQIDQVLTTDDSAFTP